ncbi:restriction endonuclease subunit S [Pseudomonas knackmussii]|uniref:restriction endonuclease subunit S n=1 Tax=Pseudomonas knackmussii TaxID=65741 RepID=UPI003BDC1646
MNAWRPSTWGDEISLEYGKGLRGYESACGPVRVFGSNGPVGWTDKALAKGPGVILGRKGAYRGVQYSEDDFFVIDTAYYVVPKTELDMRWLYYAIQYHKLGEIDDGSPIPSTTRAAVYVRELNVPPEDVQKEIARILGSIDDKIDLNRRINQTLEAIAQAIFKSWFVDFNPTKAKISAKKEGRDPLRAAMSAISGQSDAELDAVPPEQFAQLAATAALFPEEMEESDLGEIPKGWIISKVEMLLARLPAKTRYTKNQVAEFGQTPVFEQGASILLGYHDGTATYRASATEPMFIFGDHTCVTRLSCQPFDISQNVIPLQGRDRPTAWVYYAVKEKQKFQEYRRHWMELISKDVVIADVDTCLEFSKNVSNLHLQMEAIERQMQVLRELRNTLLPKLLSGELSVAEALAEAEA